MSEPGGVGPGAGPAAGRRAILVVGAGAIGGLYAAHLARVADVVVVDADRAHVAAMQVGGLVVSGRTECTARFAAFASGPEMGRRRFDAVLVLVKSQATGVAFGGVQPWIEGRPLLVTFQNGMDNDEILKSICDLDVAHGVSLEAARYDGPGRVRHLIHGQESWLGPARGGIGSVAWLGDLLQSAGLPTRVVADARGAIWAKFIFNSVMNPVGALVLGVNAARYRVPEICALVDQMAVECTRVAEALGIDLAFDPMAMVEKTRSGELPITEHAGSMALDVAAGRETEIDSMTGYVVRQAKQLGLAVPVTETVYRLMKGVEYAARARRGAG